MCSPNPCLEDRGSPGSRFGSGSGGSTSQMGLVVIDVPPHSAGPRWQNSSLAIMSTHGCSEHSLQWGQGDLCGQDLAGHRCAPACPWRAQHALLTFQELQLQRPESSQLLHTQGVRLGTVTAGQTASPKPSAGWDPGITPSWAFGGPPHYGAELGQLEVYFKGSLREGAPKKEGAQESSASWSL